ncbi:MAG TPA: LON peptidase substrate-binding domain-containing protein [Hyphomicrobiaceae bacterium]|jgi:Lon protease-like protein|nr:LON peptidase substrate-binding domain-containing protein [Hyphomicrobiaceae bacterium]
MSELYRGPADVPHRIPVFPLSRAILLPRATLPLHIFETRYLQMVDDVMSTSRVLGMVQPTGAEEEESPASRTAPLRRIGCAGRITSYEELDDGRLLISLSGIARFEVTEEVELAKPYRICTVSYERFLGDFAAGAGEEEVDRERLVSALKAYLQARDLKADWAAISKTSTETLVNSLALVSPYGSEEKQALLEAADLKTRAEMLVALAEMEMAAGSRGPGSTLQ